MGFDDPLQNPPGFVLNFFGNLNTAFTFVFVVEMLARMIALNLYGHSKSYLSDSFNQLDVILIVSSLFDFIGAYIGLDAAPSYLTAFRVVRVLKLLRLITRVPALRQVILVILHSLPAMVNILIVLVALTLSFCLVGSSLFGGKLRGVCFDMSSGLAAQQPCECRRYFTTRVTSTLGGFQCLDVAPRKIVPAPNFERIGHSAIISMSQIVSLDSWAVAMNIIMGTEGYVAEVFYFLMVIILPTYCSKLFVAQIIDSYQIVMGMDLTRRSQTLPVILRINNPLIARAFLTLKQHAHELIEEKEQQLMSRFDRLP
jgi:hypothetical protein